MIRLKTTLKILIAALREIFDEAAYSRFLERTELKSSAAAYAAFWRDRQKQPPKTRCC